MSYVEWLGANRWCLDLLCDESPKNVPGETLSGLAKRGLRRQASLGERLNILMSAELVRLHPPLRV
jgi:hypothetical protein